VKSGLFNLAFFGLPSLALTGAEDLANAWVYYRTHKTEIDAEIVENEEA